VIRGLWGLIPGNNGSAGTSNNIYFSAGPNFETTGLFGALVPVPEPSALVLGSTAALIGLGLRWHRRKRATTWV